MEGMHSCAAQPLGKIHHMYQCYACLNVSAQMCWSGVEHQFEGHQCGGRLTTPGIWFPVFPMLHTDLVSPHFSYGKLFNETKTDKPDVRVVYKEEIPDF